MLSKKNSFPERIISMLMTLFGITLVVICIFERMPRDFWGIVEFIYSSVI